MKTIYHKMSRYTSALLFQIRRMSSILISRIKRRKPQVDDDGLIIVRPLNDSQNPIEKVAAAILIISLLIVVSGAIVTGANPCKLIEDFYANIATEWASIAATVLIIDRLNERRLQKHEKERTIRQIASRSNDFALDAVQLAGDYGSLTDGSLNNILLNNANLVDAPFSHARLENAHMFGANLENADLSHAYYVAV